MRIARLILALAIAAAITMSATAAKNGGEKSTHEIKSPYSDKLLPDDYVFSGVDGKLVQTGADKWAFEFESATSVGRAEIKAGQQLEMLGSATLEKMILDTKERTDAMFRIWAKVTKFEGKNYLFAVYYLSLRKIDRPAEGKVGNETNAVAQPVNAPNDVVNIPPEIVALLKQSEVLATTEAQETRAEELQLKQDSIFANKSGLIAFKNGGYVFEADALGRGVEKFTIKLLPSQRVEDAMTQVRSEPNPVRFNVAGILTKYKGEQYLLLQKATRMYSYGNFGR